MTQQILPQVNVNKMLEYCIGKGHDISSYKVYKPLYDKYKREFDSKQIVKFKLDYDVHFRYHNKKYLIEISENDCEKYCNRLVNGYYNYDQKYYFADGQIIQTLSHKQKTWFNTNQISSLLGYASPGYLASYYSRYDIALIVCGRQKYTDVDGLRVILSRGRKPGCKSLMEQLDLNTTTKIQSPEADILEQVIDFLGEKEYKLQYPIGPYKIDMYIPEHNIAVEVDEMGHQDRDQQYEKTREDYIKKNLTTKLLRINPNSHNFRIAKELAKLNMLCL